MSSSRLTYLGPLASTDVAKEPEPWVKRLPVGFLLMVVVPTLIAGVYFLLIASPRYVSESQFIVREASREQPSSLGIALQGVGLASAQTDAFAVHKYITSRDAVDGLNASVNLPSILARPGADFIARYPGPFEERSREGLYKALQRFVFVGYDSASGISTLRVEAFNAEDAKRLNVALLDGGERLVNRLNARAVEDAVRDAAANKQLARERLDQAQRSITAFRNEARFVDPKLAATESSELIGSLRAALANLMAERSHIAAQAPQSPQLAALDERIRAYERQVSEERAKIAGPESSLAPRVGRYEDLVLTRELADREYSQATARLVSAQQDAQRQKLYLERIVAPNAPDKASRPGRLAALLKVFGGAMLLYGVAWMIWAGVREHRQD